MIQVIVYSKATGRVRRVLDPDANVPNVLAYLSQAGTTVGEAAMVYVKKGLDAQGNPLDSIVTWQSAVSALTGLIPTPLHPDVLPAIQQAAPTAITASVDRYCVIDATNTISMVVIADPACGDGYPGCTLVPHATADISWTYDGVNFVPPPVIAPPPKV
jgi:hypothetical protein